MRRLGTVVALSLMLAASALLVALSPDPAEAGGCAQPRVVLEVVPAAGRAIPRGEGVLVRGGTDPARSIGELRDDSLGSARELPELHARLERDGEAAIPLTLESLGPSVARLVPASPPAAGRWRVVSDHGSAEVTYSATPARRGPPARPHLVSITSARREWSGPRGGGVSTSVIARTRGAVGGSAIGVILYLVTAPTRPERATLTYTLRGAHESLPLFESGGRCALQLPGQSPPAPGAHVRLAAYDLWGRVGERSEIVTVESPGSE